MAGVFFRPGGAQARQEQHAEEQRQEGQEGHD